MPERQDRKSSRSDPAPTGNATQPDTFESAFTRLEETVRRLEAGKLSLDEATRLYEEGMRLATKCSELLSQAELRISRLQTQFAAQMALVQEDAADEDEADGPEQA
jgi:exodeoxyribonuclease VII small subunit